MATTITTTLEKKTDKTILTAKGDMYYASAANTPARLALGTPGQVLKVSSSLVPEWGAPDHASHKVISGTKSDGTTNIISSSFSSGNITLGDSGVTASTYGDTSDQTPNYGSTFKVPSITVNAKGIVTGIATHTVKIPASDNTNTAHSHSAGVGLTGSGTAGTSGTYTYKVNLVDETVASNAAAYTAGGASKFYAVQLDKNNKLGVYVPWTDNNTTYSAGIGLSLSGTTFNVKTGYTTSGRNYGVTTDTNGNLYVNVPWTDNNTTYTAGAGLSLSNNTFSVKTGYATNGKNYKVVTDANGNLYVNVPWTDNNTTYSAGTGLSLSGTTFSLDGNYSVLAVNNILDLGTLHSVNGLTDKTTALTDSDIAKIIPDANNRIINKTVNVRFSSLKISDLNSGNSIGSLSLNMDISATYGSTNITDVLLTGYFKVTYGSAKRIYKLYIGFNTDRTCDAFKCELYGTF